MNARTKKTANETKVQPPIILGLNALESAVDQATFVYILQSLYRIVFRSNSLNENKYQLQRRVRKFEEDCALPGFLSAIPIERFLSELEEAQYFYPIRKNEVILPKFP